LTAALMSGAKEVWDTECVARLDQLERIHTAAGGTGRGRRWGTDQLNRSLFVALVGQFQVYCRELHDEATRVYLSQANPRQVRALQTLLRQRRELDYRNPRRDALKNDFGRMGLQIIPALRSLYARANDDIDRLELLVRFRNAIAHGNESEVRSLVQGYSIRPTLRSYRTFKSTINRLVGKLDAVVAAELAGELGIRRPW
jgi:hypothetical protein